MLMRNVVETNKQQKMKGTRGENTVNLHELFIGLLFNLPKVNRKKTNHLKKKIKINL